MLTVTVTAGVFVGCLEDLGLRSDELLMVHASLRSFGRFEGGANAVIDTLMGVVNAGTIVMPTYTQRSLNRSPERDRNEFDPATEPSIDGLITECFRQRRDVIRQPNDPWHPMAVWGRDQKALIEARRGTAYGFFLEHGGRTLLVGVGHETHSFVHWMVDEAQRQGFIPKGEKIHSRFFPRLEPWFIREGAQKTLICGLSTLRLVDVVAAGGATLLALGERPDLFDMPATEEERARPINILERRR